MDQLTDNLKTSWPKTVNIQAGVTSADVDTISQTPEPANPAIYAQGNT